MDERLSRNPRAVALAALALVGLLLAIAIPVARHRREQACSQVCEANLRSMAVALELYTVDWDGCLPPARDSRDEYYWARALFGSRALPALDAQYWGMVLNSVECPSARVRESALRQVGPRAPTTLAGSRLHYKWNPRIGGKRLSELDTSTTILAYDCAPVHRGGRNCCSVGGLVKWVPGGEFQRRLREIASEEARDGAD
jgi:type II secretory pathway pseudopilin PulG